MHVLVLQFDLASFCARLAAAESQMLKKAANERNRDEKRHIVLSLDGDLVIVFCCVCGNWFERRSWDHIFIFLPGHSMGCNVSSHV